MSNPATKKLSARKAMSMCPQDVAKHFGLYYSGDENVFRYGGYFYDARDWLAFDYANCVEVWDDFEAVRTVVMEGNINRPDELGRTPSYSGLMDAMDSAGIEPDQEDYHDSLNSVRVQIEACREHFGIEPDMDCYGNVDGSNRSFRESQELAFWRHLLPILERLGN